MTDVLPTPLTIVVLVAAAVVPWGWWTIALLAAAFLFEFYLANTDVSDE